MFDKLSQREKILSIVVLCLVPVAIVFMYVFWVIGKISENDVEYQSLTQNMAAEEDREMDRLKAERRRDYYNSVSLSPRVEDATNEYLFWLKTLMNESNLEPKTFTPRDGGDLKEGRKIIGKRKKFTVPASGKIDDLTKFLTKFYEVDTLHRINGLKVVPKNEPSSNEKKIRTGFLSIIFDIEVISLKTAEENPEFANSFREVARNEDVYKNMILRRNIFGPANNEPTLSARPSSSYYVDVKANIPVTAKDADENDILKIEIVDSEVKEAELAFKEGSRLGKLVVPGQEPGKYDIKLRVVDNGFPAKEYFKSVTVTFKERPPKVVKKEKPKPPPPPPFIKAKQTYITGITRLPSGDWQLWLKVRTTGQKFKLLVGESFKLDDVDWIVKSIEPDRAVMLVEGKLLTIKGGSSFAEPINEIELDPVKSDPPAAKVEESTSAVGLESDLPPRPRAVFP